MGNPQSKHSKEPSDHNTEKLSDIMKVAGNGDPGYRGLANYSCMSIQLKKAFLFHFTSKHGRFPLLVIDLNEQTCQWAGGWCGRGASRCLLLVNSRHVACVRQDPENDRYMVADTCSVELPESANRLIRFLNESQALSPIESRVPVLGDTNTTQQPVDSGGCCVMSLQNMLLPHGVYATPEAGEALRREYGLHIIQRIARGYTVYDFERKFDAMYPLVSLSTTDKAWIVQSTTGR